MKLRKVVSVILTVCLLLSISPVIANGEITVIVNGERTEFDQAPIMENGRTLVPVRAIFEKLGAQVSYEPVRKKVYAELGSKYVAFLVGSDTIYTNDGGRKIDTPAMIINDRTYVPVRAVSEGFDAEVKWDQATKTVYVNSSPDGHTVKYKYKNYSSYSTDNNVILKGICAYPEIMLQTGAASDLNVKFKDGADDYIKYLCDQPTVAASVKYDNYKTAGGNGEFYPEEHKRTFDVTYNRGNIISFAFHTSSGTNGNYSQSMIRSGLTYDISSGKLLEKGDIFNLTQTETDNLVKTVFGNYIISDPHLYNSAATEYINDNAANAEFYLDEYGVVFFFSSGTIMNDKLQIPSVRVDYENNEGLFKMNNFLIRKNETEDAKEEIKEDIVDVIEETVQEDISDDIKEEIKEDIVDVIEETVKEDVSDDIKEEINEDIVDVIEETVKEDVGDDIKEEIKENISDVIKEDVKKEVKVRVPDEIISAIREIYKRIGEIKEEEKEPEYVESVNNKTYSVTFSDLLYSKMPTDQNYMVSPFSIKMALGLLASGAKGDTLDEIKDVIQISSTDEFNKKAKNLIDIYTNTRELKLNVANSLWLNTDYTNDAGFKPDYEGIADTYYNAQIGKINNSNGKITVNEWVNKNTEGKISTIIDDAEFVAALINAVYFNGRWEHEFNKKATQPGDFADRFGKIHTVDFMRQVGKFNYYTDDNATVIELPYSNAYDDDGEANVSKDKDFSMYVIMPKFETRPGTVEKYLNDINLKNGYIDLSIPKFKTEFDMSLSDTLKLLGMNAAFSDEADFSRLTDISMAVDDIIHKTYIDVNEEGTEAAAATAVIMKATSSLITNEPVVIKIDKPFVYVIKDKINDEILFMGEYAFVK